LGGRELIDFGELPYSWILTNLGDIVLSIQYGYTASATEKAIGPKFLRITDLQNNSVNWNTVPFCQCDETYKYELKKGDIVIARTGATTGKSFLLTEIPKPAIFASYLIRLSTSNIFLPEYIALFMQSIDYWRQITVISKGSAQPGANASILSTLSIPLPPLNEQRRLTETFPTTDSEASLDEDKRTMQPHRRRTHIRKQRYGKGLESWRYVWIKETTIHKDKYQSPQQYRIYEVSEQTQTQ
jgi:restriction endonuclease S subunit